MAFFLAKTWFWPYMTVGVINLRGKGIFSLHRQWDSGSGKSSTTVAGWKRGENMLNEIRSNRMIRMGRGGAAAGAASGSRVNHGHGDVPSRPRKAEKTPSKLRVCCFLFFYVF